MKRILSATLFVLTAACNPSIDKDLALDLIDEYYREESNGNAHFTYACRSNAFKELVPFKVYEREVEKNIHLWKTVSYEILGIHIDGKSARAKIRFQEQLTDPTVSDRAVYFSFEEETKWQIKSDGSFICVDPGFRGYHALNRIGN
jgi:hypothetical protein